MESLKWIVFFLASFLPASFEITTNLALNKTAYVRGWYETYFPSNGVDGDVDTMALCNGKNGWFVVDLGMRYRIHYVVLHTRKNCCGIRMSNFKVGLLRTFDENNFQRNELCGAYEGQTQTNTRYQLNCSQPFSMYRYVSLHVVDLIYEDMCFAELEVYGENMTDYSIQYVGCYEDIGVTTNYTVTSIDQCLYICDPQFFTYASVKAGSECVCQNALPKLALSSFCTTLCSDDEHICGGDNHSSVYNVSACTEGDKEVACTHYCSNSSSNGSCSGMCESGWNGTYCHVRDCTSDNGQCGENTCKPFSIGPAQLSECICEAGYEKKHAYYSSCTDIDECEGHNTCNNETSTCNNTVGSFECPCKTGFNKSPCLGVSECASTDNIPSSCPSGGKGTVSAKVGGAVGGAVGGVIALLILIALLLFCLCKWNRKKEGQAGRMPNGTVVEEHTRVEKVDNIGILTTIEGRTSEEVSESGKGRSAEERGERVGNKKERVDEVNKERMEEVQEESHSRINLPQLEAFCNNNHNTIVAQFKKVPMKSDKGIIEGKREKNKKKNKYKDIIPFDYNRVKIVGKENDYINASYIRSYHSNDFRFIATQGLKYAEDIEDFWTMVIQHDVTLILMLTNLFEASTMKCLQYWPDSATQEYGRVRVELKEVAVWPTYEIRTILASHTDSGKSVLVKHLFYLAWPDHGVPSNVGSFLNFQHKATQLVQQQVLLRKDNAYEDEQACVLVHCSAGVGRTGTMIGIDWLLKEAKQFGWIDPMSCLQELRKQRNKMIQSEVQFLFLHKVLNYYTKVGSTTTFSTTDDGLRRFMQAEECDTVLKTQLQLIEGAANETISNTKKNITKNLSQPECYPSFSRADAYRLQRMEEVVNSKVLLQSLLQECSFVLVLGMQAMESLKECLKAKEWKDKLETENDHSMRLNLHREQTDQELYENSLPNHKVMRIMCASDDKDIAESYKHFKMHLQISNEAPILVLYSGEARQDCLWSLVKLNLLQMVDTHKEVDVYQSVYNICKHQKPISSSPSSSNLILKDVSYKKVYLFALELVLKDCIEDEAGYDNLKNLYANDNYQRFENKKEKNKLVSNGESTYYNAMEISRADMAMVKDSLISRNLKSVSIHPPSLSESFPNT